MANAIVNRTINIYIQSGEAQRVYDQLIAKQKKLNDQIAKTTDPAAIKKLNAELDRLKEPIDRATKKLSGELEPSLKDLSATAAKTRAELGRMSESDPGFKEKVALWAEANKQIDIQKGKLGILSNAMRSFASEAKAVAAGVLLGGGVQGMFQVISAVISKVVTGSAKISDELANIQRVTGFTKNEVVGVNNELKKIDTRTSVSGLRDIVVVAGQLGIAKEDIVGFTQEVDKLSVALGGQLGDVDQITSGLGKILNVFEGKINAENLGHLGNAIIDLANKGVATAPFLVDFTQRLSGIAKASNLSLSAVLAFGAGIEEQGGRVESGATALQKIVVKIAEDIPKAAKIAGVEVEKFTDLFAKAPQEAVLLFAEGLQKNKKSFSEVASSFKDAGEEGARVIETLSKFGINADFFRQKMKESGIAITETTAKEEAFALMNKTAAAELDKLKKSVQSLFESDSVRGAGESLVRILTGIVNIIKASVDFIGQHGGLVATLGIIYALAGVRIKGFTGAMILKNTVEKISAAITAASAAAYTIFSTIVAVVTGRITLAAAAQKIWNTVASLGAGPLGLLLVAVGGLVLGIEALVDGTKKLTAEQRVQVELSKRVADSTEETQTKMKILTDVLKDNTVSLDNRKKALAELISISPDYLKGLTLENINTEEGRKILDNYNDALVRNANIKAKSALLDEQAKARAKALIDINKQQQALKNENTFFPGLSDELQTGKIGAATKDFLEHSIGPFKDLVQQYVEANENVNVLITDLTDTAKKNVTTVFNTTTDIKTGVTAAGESINSLKEKLEKLQVLRDAATSNIDTTQKVAGIDVVVRGRDGLNKEIAKVQAEISKLEGNVNKLSKAENKAANDTKQLVEELKQLATSLLPDDTLVQQFDKQLKALDDKYAKLREKAHGNTRLLKQIDDLYILERNRLYDDQAKKFKESLEKESEEVRKVFAERAANKAIIIPIIAKVEQSAVNLHNTLGRDVLAQDELNVLKSTGKDKLDFQLKQLDDEEKAELASKEHTEIEIAVIQEKYRQKRKQLEIEYYENLGENIVNYAKQALSIFDTISQGMAARENADLERDRKINDKKKQNLEKRLKAGTISQLEYNRQLQDMDKKQQAKEKEVKLKQFKRDQQAAIASTFINAAEGVIKLWAKPGFPANIPLMALLAAQTAFSIASISGRKPPEFARGGKLTGPSHSENRGMPVINPRTGSVQAYLEGDEAIVNKRTMGSSNKYTVTGTPSQIISGLNARYGGVSWTTGGNIKPHWQTIKPQPMNFPIIRQAQMFADGGRFSPQGPTGNTDSDIAQMQQTLINLSLSMNQMAQTNSLLQQQLANGITAKTFLSDQEAAQDRMKSIRDDATFQ